MGEATTTAEPGLAWYECPHQWVESHRSNGNNPVIVVEYCVMCLQVRERWA